MIRPTIGWTAMQRRLVVGAVVLLAVAIASTVQASRREAASVTLLRTGPGTQNTWLSRVEQEIAGAKERIWAVVYVISPGEKGPNEVDNLLKALGQAKRRGVDVRVCIDIDSGKWADDKHIDGLKILETYGIPAIVDEAKTRTHAKFMIFDQDLVIVGSHNWTHSALVYNREASLLVRDADITRQLASWCESIPGWHKMSGHP